MGYSAFAAPFGDHCHFLAVLAGTGKGGVDAAFRRLRDAGYDREIATINAVRSELLGETFMRDIGLGYDEKARRVLVDTMDDTGPGDTANPR